jgi:hypothetical protein
MNHIRAKITKKQKDNSISTLFTFDISLEDAKDYINRYNGTNESYFEDYKGGIVSIICNETEEVVFETEVL